MDLDAIRDRLVLALPPHAAFDGWSWRSLAAAAADEGLAATMPARLFPKGGIDAVAHFVRLGDRLMPAEMEAADLTALRVPERLAVAVEARLRHWADHREAARRALALLALPGNLPLAARLAWGTADALWRGAGDRSHDFAWYTRRSTLAAIWSATVLYWLEDTSEGGVGTMAFLRRRLADAGRLTKARKEMGGLFERLRPR